MKYILVLIVLLPGILSLAMRYTTPFLQPSLDRVEKVYKEKVISQSFYASRDRLTGFGLSIKNPNLINKKDLTLSLYDENNNLLTTTTRNGGIIADGNFVKLFFDPVQSSKDKKFTIIFEAKDAVSEEALEIFLTNNKQKWMDNLSVNGQKSDGGISMVSFYSPSNPLVVVFDIYQGWLKKIIADPLFAAAYFIVLSLSGGYLFFYDKKK